jgi:hypothetical protein
MPIVTNSTFFDLFIEHVESEPEPTLAALPAAEPEPTLAALPAAEPDRQRLRHYAYSHSDRPTID